MATTRLLATPRFSQASFSTSAKEKANIAVIGAGWWSQGWHLPHLHRNPGAHLAAIVDSSSHPKSNLNPNLQPLSALSDKYGAAAFSSVGDLLRDPLVGPTLDGVIVATPHATHYAVGEEILKESQKRQVTGKSPIHILMEKPFTTNVHEAKKLHDLVSKDATNSVFFGINHSGNFRRQSQVARQLIESGEIGEIRHVTLFFASALSWIFEDPTNTGWNEPTKGMLGNGFGWGQSSHILAWMYHTCPTLRPQNVYCAMNHSPITGADVAHAATIRCSNETSHDVVVSLSGTSLLPGNEHSNPSVGKQIRLKIYGTKGAIIYSGDSGDPSSGRLELRRAPDGGVELPLGPDVGFEFENLDMEGTGPESLESFVQACRGNTDYYVGADSMTGLRTVQTLDAMYRSEHSKHPENVEYS